eukprot:g10316.t1
MGCMHMLSYALGYSEHQGFLREDGTATASLTSMLMRKRRDLESGKTSPTRRQSKVKKSGAAPRVLNHSASAPDMAKTWHGGTASSWARLEPLNEPQSETPKSQGSRKKKNKKSPKAALPRVRQTALELMKIALPTMFSNFLTLLNEFTNTVCLGHVGNDAELAAVGLGNMMQNCFGLSIAFGLSTALDTLVSQAHGAGEHNL